MKELTLKKNIGGFKPIFRSWNEVSPKKWVWNIGRIVSARWSFGTTSPGASTYTISIPLAIIGSCHGEVGFQLYRTGIGICLSYQQQGGIQGCHNDEQEYITTLLYRWIHGLWSFLNKMAAIKVRSTTFQEHPVDGALVTNDWCIIMNLWPRYLNNCSITLYTTSIQIELVFHFL